LQEQGGKTQSCEIPARHLSAMLSRRRRACSGEAGGEALRAGGGQVEIKRKAKDFDEDLSRF